MGVSVAIAGVISVVLGLGHETVGRVWVLPMVTETKLKATPFGPAGMSLGMIRVTWHIVTIFALTTGGLLITLAWAPGADPRTVLLRWLAAMWVVATIMAFAVTRPSPRTILRLPVPLLWVVTSLLLWRASL